jgi:glyoxylase-like metal-dependent hydrolase (beta-lactamase superfamily II)
MLGAGLLLAACGTSTPHATASGASTPRATIHTVTGSPQGILVNAYLVEGPHAVVAVDSALTVSDAKQLRATFDALHKPLMAVLLTHGHPDHYNGITTLIEGLGDVPIYATEAVDRVIRDSDAAKEAQWKPIFGAEWPARRTFPTHVLHDADTLELDGFVWTVHAVGPGESHADSYWTLGTEQQNVFLGDEVIHREHAYVSDGHTTRWLENLTLLRDQLRGAARLYPGHGAAGGLELLDWQRAYLEAYRAEVETLRQGEDHLSETAKQELTARMKARYPEAGLDFLIGLGADAVAKELASDPRTSQDDHAEHGEQP